MRRSSKTSLAQPLWERACSRWPHCALNGRPQCLNHGQMCPIKADFIRAIPFPCPTFPRLGLAPAYGPRCAQVSLTPVPLRGHAVTGHPWPITALPASMPGEPLRRTSTRPPEGAGRSKAMPAEAADRPACLAARSARLAHLLCGSGLARDASGAVFELNRADAIASKPAPTEEMCESRRPRRQTGRPPRRALLLIYRPLREAEWRFCAVEVLRSGSPGMDAGRAVMGHGWPVTACPRSGTGTRDT